MNNPSNFSTSASSIPSEMKTTLQIVLNSLPSPKSKRVYKMGIRDFLFYWVQKGRPIPDKLFLQTYIFDMEENGVGRASINIRLAAIKNFAREAADLNVWPDTVPAAFSRVKKIALRGTRSGVWLTLEQAQVLINAPDVTTNKGLRDRALLAVLLGCGLRRSEAKNLAIEHIQKRSNAWVLANIIGKRNKVRTVILPEWAKKAIDSYVNRMEISSGYLFRPMSKSGEFIDGDLSSKTIYRIVKMYANKCGLPAIAPHDLRRTYAKLAYKNGAKLDQIQINLGHDSLTTTQKYLGIELDLEDGPGNYLNIRID